MLKIRELQSQQCEIKQQQCWCMYKTVMSDCSFVTEVTINRMGWLYSAFYVPEDQLAVGNLMIQYYVT